MTYWRASRREAPALGALNSSMLPGSHALGDQRDSIIPFPSGSYRSADETFEPLKVPPSLFEIAGLACTLFFGCALGGSFFAALYILFLSPL